MSSKCANDGKSTNKNSHKSMPTPRPLQIFYYNARSLLPKVDELCALVEAESPDVICIVESWLSSEISDDELAIDKYQILRLDRNRHGGGVIMYVHCCLSPKVLFAGDNDLELLIVSVSPEGSSCNCCISLFYRPPSSSIEAFESLCTALQSLSPTVYNSFVLIGGFNVEYICTHATLYKRLTDCLPPFSLYQVVSHATHVSPNGSTSLIDLVFMSNLSQLRYCTVIPPLANSDHNGIQLELTSPMTTTRKPGKPKVVWKYAQADFEMAKVLIDSTNWDALLSGDVNVSITSRVSP